jgi:hypothetical protein
MSPHLKPQAIAIVILMIIGSLALWVVIPLGWILLASSMTTSTQPTMGPYLMVLFGIPITMVVVGKGLSKLNTLYGKVTGTTPEVRVTAPWHRSMRGERDSGRPLDVLSVVMIISVSLAATCFGLWFFLFAGSSIG